jgi:radical SAM superfamily enzyme YgiQ (UPF0313 family)
MAALKITIMIGCPLKCTFCPQGNLKDAFKDDSKIIAVQNFEKLIRKLPLQMRIDFSGMSEPWAYP